ncbi:MAG: hypothetical protein GXY76_06300 [Chloroflexi bacterium]|nr:hypothetical protein [Chloroflexota bacterium]
MLQQVRLLEWLLEVDTEATAATYRNVPSDQDCTCAYCRNFRAAWRTLPAELLQVLETLGIDPAKPLDITEFWENEDGTHFYMGMYNLVGRIVDGDDYRTVSRKSGQIDLHPLVENAGIGFTGDVDFGRGFPTPILQAEFMADVPWVLGEKP